MSLADSEVLTGTADDHYWHGPQCLPDDDWSDPDEWAGWEQWTPPDTEETP